LSPTPAHHLPPPLRKLLAPLLSQEPAAQLIRRTARQQWRLLAVLLQGLQSLSRRLRNLRRSDGRHGNGSVEPELHCFLTTVIYAKRERPPDTIERLL
jgi:hypothetical protein